MLQFVIGLDLLRGDDKNSLETRVSCDSLLFSSAGYANMFVPVDGYIELVGAWEELCIKSVVLDALQKSTIVQVPKGFTYKLDSSASSLKKNIYESALRRNISYLFKSNELFDYYVPS